MNIDNHTACRLHDMYLRDKMSTREISESSLQRLGIFISTYQVYALLKKNGVTLRSVSQGVSRAKSNIDPDQSFMNESTLEWTDGFLLGDGSIRCQRKVDAMGARFSIGSLHTEWSSYAMSGLSLYRASVPKPTKTIDKKHPHHTWISQSLTHPDIVKQYMRWYPNGTKDVPEDVRITPSSVLLWYLGDGSICSDEDSNYSALRLATCSFSPEKIESVLIPKLTAVGIECVREKSKNDIRIRTSSIRSFFDFIGRTSPIECYAYKFQVPEWLYLSRLEDIAQTPQERYRAIYYIKTGKVQCSSSPGGKMFLFNHSQVAQLRCLLDKTGR